MSGPAIADRARRVATSGTPLRERLGALIALAAEARRLEDPAERRRAELAVFEAARPLLEDEERPVRGEPAAPDFAPLGDDDLVRRVAAMNARRARREALLPSAAEVPVEGPRWAARILDAGHEVLAIHRETGSAYALALFTDLDPEASGAVVAARLARRGFSREQVARVLEALELPDPSRRRVLDALGGGPRCR